MSKLQPPGIGKQINARRPPQEANREFEKPAKAIKKDRGTNKQIKIRKNDNEAEQPAKPAEKNKDELFNQIEDEDDDLRVLSTSYSKQKLNNLKGSQDNLNNNKEFSFKNDTTNKFPSLRLPEILEKHLNKLNQESTTASTVNTQFTILPNKEENAQKTLKYDTNSLLCRHQAWKNFSILDRNVQFELFNIPKSKCPNILIPRNMAVFNDILGDLKDNGGRVDKWDNQVVFGMLGRLRNSESEQRSTTENNAMQLLIVDGENDDEPMDEVFEFHDVFIHSTYDLQGEKKISKFELGRLPYGNLHLEEAQLESCYLVMLQPKQKRNTSQDTKNQINWLCVGLYALNLDVDNDIWEKYEKCFGKELNEQWKMKERFLQTIFDKPVMNKKMSAVRQMKLVEWGKNRGMYRSQSGVKVENLQDQNEGSFEGMSETTGNEENMFLDFGSESFDLY